MPSGVSIASADQNLARAIEELNRESAEARDHLAATSEILGIISSSPADLLPVFETLIKSAVKLCQATRGFVARFDGEVLRFVAGCNVTPELRTYFEQNPFAVDRHSNTGRAAFERRTIHNVDVQADPEYTYGGYQVDPYRTVLATPMLKANELLGVILIYRHEVLPFTNSQIALIETFAAQAVIAIENTRLLNELRQRTDDLSEALQQQTATSQVLQVISSSPGDLEPVFEAMLENATRVCDAKFATLYLRDADAFLAVAATHDAPLAYLEARKPGMQVRPPSETPLAACCSYQENRPYRRCQRRCNLTGTAHPFIVAAVELGGFRTILAVPMLKEGDLVGAIAIYRQEVRPFTDKQVELVRTSPPRP